MEVAIAYFSQTGNTRKVAEAMAEEFKRSGHNAICHPIGDARPELFEHCDILGIGSATFESHAPTPIKDFVRALPPLRGKRSFVFATCGGASGNTLPDLSRLLRDKGAEIIGGFLSIGEVRHPAPCILGKSEGRPNAEDLRGAKDFALAIGRRTDHASAAMYAGPRAKRGFYNLVGVITSSERLIRLLEPKPRLDANACRKCGRCAVCCPMRNIAMSPSPVHGGKCIRCYHCLRVCANRAYAVNWRFGNLVVSAFWNTCFMRWFGEYDKPSHKWQRGVLAPR